MNNSNQYYSVISPETLDILTLNQRAVGSSPTAPTKVFNDLEIKVFRT